MKSPYKKINTKLLIETAKYHEIILNPVNSHFYWTENGINEFVKIDPETGWITVGKSTDNEINTTEDRSFPPEQWQSALEWLSFPYRFTTVEQTYRALCYYLKPHLIGTIIERNAQTREIERVECECAENVFSVFYLEHSPHIRIQHSHSDDPECIVHEFNANEYDLEDFILALTEQRYI